MKIPRSSQYPDSFRPTHTPGTPTVGLSMTNGVTGDSFYKLPTHDQGVSVRRFVHTSALREYQERECPSLRGGRK